MGKLLIVNFGLTLLQVAAVFSFHWIDGTEVVTYTLIIVALATIIIAREAWFWERTAHNDYLAYLHGVGVPSGFGMGAAAFIFWWVTGRGDNQPFEVLLLTIVLIAIALFIGTWFSMVLATGTTRYNEPSWLMFWAALPLGVGLVIGIPLYVIYHLRRIHQERRRNDGG